MLVYSLCMVHERGVQPFNTQVGVHGLVCEGLSFLPDGGPISFIPFINLSGRFLRSGGLKYSVHNNKAVVRKARDYTDGLNKTGLVSAEQVQDTVFI